MKRNQQWMVIANVILVTLISGCAQQPPAAPPDTRAADESAIRKADIDWSNAAQTKQADAWVAFYSDDVTFLAPNAPMVSGKDAARKAIGDLLSLPGLSLKWEPKKIEVSKSGDIAYSVGTYEMSLNDPKGNPIMERGKYTEVWKKQADGSWKCAVDMFSSDLPATPPAPAK
jgi:ketosteroid isomerase-like protein